MFEAKYEPLYLDEKAYKEIDNFYQYFIMEEDNLIKALYNNDKNYMVHFEHNLEKVFFRYTKKLRYIFEKKEDTFHFKFFYGRNSYLLTISNEFLSFDLNKFKHKWIFEISQ